MNGVRSFLRHASVLALLAVLAAALGASTASSRTSDLTNPKHFFWAPGQNPSGTVADSTANDLIYHGGNAGSGAIGVETKPAVYLVYWGPQWARGFTTADTDGKLYSSKTLQTYLDSFFGGVGGSPWANVQTQYCKDVLPGSTSCVGGTGFVTNPKDQLKGVWTDPTPVPDDIVASASRRTSSTTRSRRRRCGRRRTSSTTRARRTSSSRRRATIATGQPVYCGYHSQTTSVDGLGNPYRIQYAFIPWLNTNWPGVGTGGCGMHNVNATSDAFGNGVFDGYSIVTGHEYAEAVTDPGQLPHRPGRLERRPGERERRQVRVDSTRRTSRSASHQFAVQPLWSNEAYDATGNGCVVAR